MRQPLQMSPRTLGILAAVVTVTIWTSFVVIARASADPARGGSLDPFDMTLTRVSGASLVLLPLGWWLVRRDRAQGVGASSMFGFSPLPLRITATSGVFGGMLYAVFAYSGFVYAPAAHASVMMPGSLPLWTTLLALVVLGTRITPARWLGLALIVGGAALVGGPSLWTAFDGGQLWKGDLLFMAAAMSWSAYSVLARKNALDAVRATIAITAFMFFVYVPAYTVLLALGVVSGGILRAPWSEIVFQMGFQGLGSVAIAGVAFTRMIQHFGPVRSTMITAVVPGLSALAAVLLLGEPLYWNLVLGLVLVTGGIVFGVRGAAAPVLPAAASAPAMPRRGA